MTKHIFLAIFSLWSVIATAQWTTNTEENTLVSNLSSDDMKSVGTSNGFTYVVFWHSVAAPENYELRLQVLSPQGEQMLGDQGVLVSDDLPMSTFTVLWNIIVDSQDNLYVGVTGTGGGEPAYVFKMDLEGNRLWGSSGINVGSGYAVKMLPLAGGEVLVAWWPSSGVGQIQKFDSSGQAVWSNSQPVSLGSSNTVVGNMFELDDGQVLIVFHEVLSGINSFLHAQRFDTTGAAVWSSPVQMSDQATVFNRDYQGTIIDNTIYMGYFASSGTRFDTFLQCIAPDGNLPWGINGSSFDTTQAYYEMEPYMAYKVGSGVIWMSSTYSNTSQSAKGTYLQKYDRITGDRLFGDDAFELFAVGSEAVPVGGMNIAEQGPILLIKEGVDNGATPTELKAIYLEDNGQAVWPEGLRDVATFQANKGRINHTRMVDDQSVVTFVEQKSTSTQVFAQNIFSGEVVLSQNTVDTSSRDMIFTNPFDGQLNYQQLSAKGVNAEVFEASSRRILGPINIEALHTYDTSLWPQGLYFLNVTDQNNHQKVFRLVKQ